MIRLDNHAGEMDRYNDTHRIFFLKESIAVTLPWTNGSTKNVYHTKTSSLATWNLLTAYRSIGG